MNTANYQNIENRLNRALGELNILYEVSCAMHTTLKLDHILYIILTGVTSHLGLGYNRALLFLLKPKSNQLEFTMGIGPESGEHANTIWESIEQSNQKMEDLIKDEKISQFNTDAPIFKAIKNYKVNVENDTHSLLAQAFNKKIPWHLPPETISQYSYDQFIHLFPSNALLIMPLIAKDKVIGLIVADNAYTQKPITQDDIRIFTMLANQAALAIENSRLYEIIVHKSHTDSLTNLWNHGYFQEKLSNEIKQAGAAKYPLSLAMIDIDNFKNLNDAYGHQHGDTILKQIAQILKDSSREKDYICRYGGEEFCIILGQTKKEQSFEIAERLRKEIEQYPFPDISNSGFLPVTVSIGLSSFPEDATTKEALVALADKAMYMAKFSGKNKTCTSDN